MKRLLLFGLLCAVPAIWAQPETAQSAEGSANEKAGEHETPEPPIMYKWVNFAILAAGLGYLIATKGMPALNDRAASIQSALQAAEKIKAEAAEQEAAIARKMSGLKGEIEAMRVSAKQEMEAERVRLAAETQGLVAKLQANGEAEIATLTKQAQNALRAQASELALGLARQKVAARINAATDANLISGFVSDLKTLHEVRN